MPEELRETLKRRFRERVSWWLNEFSDSTDTVRAANHDRPKSKLSYTRTLRAELTGSCVKARQALGIEEDADNVVSEFIERGFLEGYYEEQERIRDARRRAR